MRGFDFGGSVSGLETGSGFTVIHVGGFTGAVSFFFFFFISGSDSVSTVFELVEGVQKNVNHGLFFGEETEDDEFVFPIVFELETSSHVGELFEGFLKSVPFHGFEKRSSISSGGEDGDIPDVELEMGRSQSGPGVIISDIVTFGSTELLTSINGPGGFFSFNTGDGRERFFFFFFVLMHKGCTLSGKTNLSVRMSFFVLIFFSVHHDLIFNVLFDGFSGVKKTFLGGCTLSVS